MNRRVRESQESQSVTIHGQRLKFTNLNKVMYPSTGTTKRDVIDYYRKTADALIRYAADRPVTRKRFVNGVGTAENPGKVFFQKNLGGQTPRWVLRRGIEHQHRTDLYPLADGEATLAWLAQIAALELHVPQWRFGKNGKPRPPDRLVLDLDPGDGIGLAECAEVARLARDVLTDMGLEPFPVTSGSKGLHVYAPLDGQQSSEQVENVAKELARSLAADNPELVVSTMDKSERKGRVFVDWSQNSASKTTVCPYSLRGKLRPTVAAPRGWDELDSSDLQQLELTDVLARVNDGSTDRLAEYRGKRDQTKTSEPVPGRERPGAGNSFVIHEHHASNLHWDFRLERDGVLVSWALPKGLPDDPTSDHLAVGTEDHPLEYATFEGTIPQGQYGSGTVKIFDEGTYEAEKWNEGKEIVVVLHGRRSGLGARKRFALIHTGSSGKKENWLIHLMDRATGSNAKRAAASASRSPMLATLGAAESLDGKTDWSFEMKWDGIRAIAAIDGDDIHLTTRNGIDVTPTYPEIAGAGNEITSPNAVLDGEIVAFDHQRPSFRKLQQRMNLTKKRDIASMRRKVPVQFIVFDVLTADDDLRGSSYAGRRDRLSALVGESREAVIHLTRTFNNGVRSALEESKKFGLEGVVAKRRDSTYSPGTRSTDWIKIKFHRTQEVVVIGWRPGNGSRSDTFGSLLLGIHEGKRLRYIGRVGTGFDGNALDDIRRRLNSLVRKTPPARDVPRSDGDDANWVTPKLVGEVAFSEWTPTGRLRQPSWRGLRPDKNPGAVVKET